MKNWWNLPNALTLGRIFLTPVLVVLLLTGIHTHGLLGIAREYIAILLFVVASITDGLDGWLARRRGEVTRLGTLLDPIADKLLISSVLISLVGLRLAPAWIVVVILGRELSVTGLKLVALENSIQLHSSRTGKLKMVAEVVAVIFIFLGATKDWSRLAFMGTLGLYIVMILALGSGAEYLLRFVRGIRSLETKR